METAISTFWFMTTTITSFAAAPAAVTVNTAAGGRGGRALSASRSRISGLLQTCIDWLRTDLSDAPDHRSSAKNSTISARGHPRIVSLVNSSNSALWGEDRYAGRIAIP